MIPDPRNTSPTPESIVIEILSQKPRLAMKDLYEYFKKKYRPGMTIQGLYKLVRQLIRARIVVKEGKLLLLDVVWVHNLINLTDTLKQVYLEYPGATANILLKEGESKTFTFEKPIDMDNFWGHALIAVAHYYQDHEHTDKNVYNYNHHTWYQLVRTSSEQALANAYQQMGMHWYLVSGSKSYLDSLIAPLIEADDFHYVQIDRGALHQQNYYVVVIGDFIFETEMPKYIFELMEKIYDRVRAISEFNAQEILSLISQIGRTSLTISRDKRRAGVIRNKIKKVFT